MTRIDEPVGLADRMSAALSTIKAHENHGRCLNCPPEGPCRVEWWALKELAQLHRLGRQAISSPPLEEDPSC